MKTRAVRLYGKDDLRLEEFDLPPLGKDEILAQVVSDSLCMSSHKAAKQGAEHKRIPKDAATNPPILGHEFSGRILEVGPKWREKYKVGGKFSIQPALNIPGIPYAVGYSFKYVGGNATRVVVPNEVIERNCLLPYSGAGYFPASLSEPMSCIIGAFHATYHAKPGVYTHEMGIAPGGNVAILAGVGPMGLGTIDYAMHGGRKPGLIVVTDIDEARLRRAEQLYPPEEAEREGIRLLFVNTRTLPDAAEHLRSLTAGKGYDDVFVFAPVKPVIECGDRILGHDGCLNFFAGPTDAQFRAELNFYNVHYASTHVMGTSGGNTQDMQEALDLMSAGKINPAGMITHVGGLNCAAQTTLDLPNIPGGKKLIYTNIDMPLTAISDFEKLGATDPLFAKLAEITGRHKGLWSVEAEEHLLGALSR